MPLRCLVCEDALGYRLLLTRLLEEVDFEVVGQAAAWEEAERLAAQLEPDVLLADLWMPDLDVEGLDRLRAAAPGAFIVALSGLSVEDARRVVGRDDRADLFLSKRQPPDDLMGALCEALAQRGQRR